MPDAPPLLIFAVYALATARLTALAVGRDKITENMALAIASKINPYELETGWRHQLAYLATCVWCASVWVGLLLTAPAAYWFPTEPWALLPALALAFSQITGMTSGWGRSTDGSERDAQDQEDGQQRDGA